jgi:hypothetical protein
MEILQRVFFLQADPCGILTHHGSANTSLATFMAKA